MSPIRGMTDSVLPAFPRLGKLRKGGQRPESGRAPGQELKHWRFTSDRPEVAKAFQDAYGEAPVLLHVYLPHASLDDNWQTWKELWAAGGLQHRCDGETMSIWLENGKYQRGAKPCPFTRNPDDKSACKPIGRLSVILPELWKAGHIGYVTMETHSVNDLLSIQASLLATLEHRGDNPLGLRGIEFVLKRVPEMISTPSQDGGRARREKWLVKLEPAADWVRLQLEATKQQAAALLAAGPAPLRVDTATGEVLDDDLAGPPEPDDLDDDQPVDGDSREAEPLATGTGIPWQEDPSDAAAFRAHAKRLGMKGAAVLAALGCKKGVGEFAGSLADARERLELYARLSGAAEKEGLAEADVFEALGVKAWHEMAMPTAEGAVALEGLLREYAEWKAGQAEE